jgi:hypothetical protein
MPFVLSGKRGELVVESRRVRHDLAFTVDPVTLTPVIEHACSPSEVGAGTRMTLKWPRSLEGDRASLTSLAENFACFNPHLAITVGARNFRRSIRGGGSGGPMARRSRTGTTP